jgi:hypothetical protein
MTKTVERKSPRRQRLSQLKLILPLLKLPRKKLKRRRNRRRRPALMQEGTSRSETFSMTKMTS